MKKLDVNITKAQLTSFSIQAEDGQPIVTANLSLMTEGGKQVTPYSTDNHSWRKNPLVVPFEAMPLIGELARILEASAVKNCRDDQLALPAAATEDRPIDLSEIPF